MFSPLNFVIVVTVVVVILVIILSSRRLIHSFISKLFHQLFLLLYECFIFHKMLDVVTCHLISLQEEHEQLFFAKERPCGLNGLDWHGLVQVVSLVDHHCRATVGLHCVLSYRVPVLEQLDLCVVKEMPHFLVRAQLRLDPHKGEIMASSVKDETLEFVDYHVRLWIVKTSQLVQVRSEEKRWQSCQYC